MKKYCVYMHKNKVNGKVYIGMTCDIKTRWKSNGIQYKPHGEKSNERPFWNAIKKYGFDNFEHIIIEENLTEEEACEKEKYYIKKYNARERGKGYNIAEGGNGGRIYIEHPRGMLGKHHNEEFKKRQSNMVKEMYARGVFKDMWKTHKHPRGMLGKHHTEEHKEKLRNIPSHKHGSAKKVLLIYPNGTKKLYGCLKYLCQENGISGPLATRIIKSDKPYKINKNCHTNLENLRKIEGCTIKYLENTEVSGSSS